MSPAMRDAPRASDVAGAELTKALHQNATYVELGVVVAYALLLTFALSSALSAPPTQSSALSPNHFPLIRSLLIATRGSRAFSIKLCEKILHRLRSVAAYV